MHDKRKRKRVFHINMLKRFCPPGVGFWVEEGHGEESDEMQGWKCESKEPPLISDTLNKEQTDQLQNLLKHFSSVLQSKPGRTSVVQHVIEVGEARPVRLVPYRIPHAYRKVVQEELAEMLEAGIITPSSSAWASPIVLVDKKDGSLRLCVDFRKLNAVAQMDAYPIPRIDELIDRLGKAKYVSTLDLARGYWQVRPVLLLLHHMGCINSLSCALA